MKALKSQLPKANFESQIFTGSGEEGTTHLSLLKDADVNSSIISVNPLHDEGSVRVSQADNKSSRHLPSESKKSSVSLLARNQSQKLINLSKEHNQSSKKQL